MASISLTLFLWASLPKLSHFLFKFSWTTSKLHLNSWSQCLPDSVQLTLECLQPLLNCDQLCFKLLCIRIQLEVSSWVCTWVVCMEHYQLVTCCPLLQHREKSRVTCTVTSQCHPLTCVHKRMHMCTSVAYFDAILCHKSLKGKARHKLGQVS